MKPTNNQEKKVIDIFKEAEKTIYSLEFFPPDHGESLDSILNTIEVLNEKFGISFVSVTCGALGSCRGGTIPLAGLIQRKFDLPAVAHFIAAGRSKQTIESLCIDMHYEGLRNILALRGDPRKGDKVFVPHPEGHCYSSGLVEQLMKMNRGIYLPRKEGEEFHQGLPTDFCLSVAGYPECHPECLDAPKDLEHLKMKIDAGADYIMCQMVFDANIYENFVARARRAGIMVPVIPGIYPFRRSGEVNWVASRKEAINVSLPADFLKEIEKYQAANDKVGVENTCVELIAGLCKDLIKVGAPGLHFYTMNRPESTAKILERL